MSAPRTRASWGAGVWDSFWLLPAVFAVGAVLLAILLSALELRLTISAAGLLPSGPVGARDLLSAIITAMISFTALVFSITVVALQLASSQYSPLILRTFLQDRSIQVALGTFVATFLFAMVVLAALPAESDERLPELSLAASMALVLASTGVFIYYLHHITTIMRVSHIIASVGEQTRHSINHHYPALEDSHPADLGMAHYLITAPSPGMISDIDVDQLARVAREHNCALVVVPAPGGFVVEGEPLIRVHQVGDGAPRRPSGEDVAAAVSIGPERSPGQDVEFGIRQLADIAERALSPGVNDTTTAIRALQETHDLLRRVAARTPAPWIGYDEDGMVRAVAQRQSFDSFLAIAIDDVRHAGRDQPRVETLLANILSDLARVAVPANIPDIRRRQI